MINPFKDTNWNPDRAERRKFARSLVIGFPALAVVFALAGLVKTHAFPAWTISLAVIGAGAGAVFWIVPQIARPFYLAWYFLACCIGSVVSNALLVAFYYLVITRGAAHARARARSDAAAARPGGAHVLARRGKGG